MSVIIELFEFFAFCLNQIWVIMESVNLGGYIVLDIFVSMGYISITFWGIFSLLRNNDTNEDGE